MSDLAYANLVTPINQKSGIAEFALLALVSWFAADGIKAPVAPFTAAGDSLTIKDPHEFKYLTGNTGPKYTFIKFGLAPQKNKLDVKTTGDLGTNGQMSELEIFVPGSYAVAHEKVKNLLNTPLIVLAKDSNCPADLYYQLGCDCQFAYLTGDFSTSTTKDGAKGYTLKITFDDGPQFYAPEVDGDRVAVEVLP